MQVYDRKEWYSSRYYFNGFGKGFVDGPWVGEINNLILRFKAELARKLIALRKETKESKKIKIERNKQMFDKFSSLCNT